MVYFHVDCPVVLGERGHFQPVNVLLARSSELFHVVAANDELGTWRNLLDRDVVLVSILHFLLGNLGDGFEIICDEKAEDFLIDYAILLQVIQEPSVSVILSRGKADESG